MHVRSCPCRGPAVWRGVQVGAGPCRRNLPRRAQLAVYAKTADGPSVAIVGVTGAVGQEFLRVRIRELRCKLDASTLSVHLPVTALPLVCCVPCVGCTSCKECLGDARTLSSIAGLA
jgi:hypothetical protein